ncbi:MAG: cytochrome b/b6 domain-containing protein [Syntrophomonas sp.]
MGKNRIKFSLDLLMALSLLFLMVPVVLGQTVHEWAGLVIGVVFIVHIVLNWNWIKAITLKLHRQLTLRVRLNYMLNLLIFIGFAAILLSGMYISKTIDFSWLGIDGGGRVGWKLLHTSVSYLTFIIVGIHAGMNFPWVIHVIQKGFQPINKGGSEYGI